MKGRFRLPEKPKPQITPDRSGYVHGEDGDLDVSLVYNSNTKRYDFHIDGKLRMSGVGTAPSLALAETLGVVWNS